MNELYREIMVKRKTSVGKQLLKVLMIGLTVLMFLAGMALWPALIAAVALGIACYFVIPKFNVEYEYLYVNGDLDIDAIYSQQKRKRIAEYHMEEVEILAPEKSHVLDCYRNKNDIKVKDFTSHEPNAKVYVLIVNKDNAKQMVKVELDDIVIGDMRRIAPRKVNLM